MDSTHAVGSRAVLLVVLCAVVAAPVVATSGVLSGTTEDAGDTDLDGEGAAATLDFDTVPARASASGMARQAATESEPNDDLASADAIESGAEISGAVDSLQDVDAFSITAASATTLTVDLSRGAGSGTLGVAVFDAQGNFLGGQFVSSEGQVSFDTAAPRPGPYYVIVAAGSQFTTEPGFEGTGSYTLAVTDTTGTPGTATETEPNDDGTTANRLQADLPVRGSVAAPDDLDYYAVETLSAGTLQVTLDRPPGAGTLAVGVFDPQGNFVDGRFAEAGGQTAIAVQASQPGRYLVLVASGAQFTTEDGASGPEGTGQYDLRVSTDGDGPPTTPTPGPGTPTPDGFETPAPDGFETPTPGGFLTPSPTPDGFETPTSTPTPPAGGAEESEPNDGPRQANAVGFGDAVAGEVAGPGDRDWYVFDATAGETFNATLARTDGDGSFRVLYYYANGTVFAEFRSVGPDGRARLFATPPASGQYYVRVASPDGSGPYTFSVAGVSGDGQGLDAPGGGVDLPGNVTATPSPAPSTPTPAPRSPTGTATDEGRTGTATEAPT
jgi:hypothetical protein